MEHIEPEEVEMKKRKLRQQRALAFVLSLMIGLPTGLRSVWHFVEEPAVYQRIIWTFGCVVVAYVIIGCLIVLATNE